MVIISRFYISFCSSRNKIPYCEKIILMRFTADEQDICVVFSKLEALLMMETIMWSMFCMLMSGFSQDKLC